MTVDVGFTGGIITGGLGRPACRGIIMNLPFRLACLAFPSPLGGSIPLEPGEIHDFYTPVELQNIDGRLVDPKAYGKKTVKIKVESRFFKNEKEYLVSESTAKRLVKIANMANVTRGRIKVAITEIRKVATRATVRIKNLKKKYWS
jgi:hypothetical protein